MTSVPRRRLLLAPALGLLGGTAACGPSAAPPTAPTTAAPEGDAMPTARRLGAEWEQHSRTVMSWPTAEIWAGDTPDVQDEIAEIAATLAEFEPVTLLVSPGEEESAREAVGDAVELLAIPVDDLWARDTVPVFVETGNGIEGLDLNFNGWGDKQAHADDGEVAARYLEAVGLPRRRSSLVGEGGSLETDGQGTLLVTESSLVNDNRNPGLTRDQVEAHLLEELGLDAVIWCAGVRGEDITDAHIDSLVRFVAPGVVLLDVPGPGAPDDVWARSSAQAREVLAQARDARGERLEILELPQPDVRRIRGEDEDFLASYVNFFVGNGVVLLPEFGDRTADRRAAGILQDAFPDREVIALPIDTIAAGGGGIHCATHDVPAL